MHGVGNRRIMTGTRLRFFPRTDEELDTCGPMNMQIGWKCTSCACVHEFPVLCHAFAFSATLQTNENPSTPVTECWKHFVRNKGRFHINNPVENMGHYAK